MQIGYELLNKEDLSANQQEVKMAAIEKFKNAGCQNIYIDVDEKRTQFKKAIDSLKNGDILVILQFSRLGTSRYSFLKNLQKLKNKSVHLHCLESNYLLLHTSSFAEDKTLLLKLFPDDGELIVFQARATDKRKRGRPRVLTPERQNLFKLLKTMYKDYKDFSISGSCELACISRTAYYKYLA